MFKKVDYIHFNDLIFNIMVLETRNREIDIEKIKNLPGLKDEFIKEFISTNNIEGDIVKMNTAKLFLKEELSESDLQKRWIGIKYAHNMIWLDDYQLNMEYMHETHRALMRKVDITGGVWKAKLNQVGSLITSLPEEVPAQMNNLITTYLSSKMTEGPSIFNIIPLISEFLAIHPYEDGNGRMSRLIMNRELYNAGFKFVKYISVSKFLWKRRDEYISALEHRNVAWASGTLSPADLIPLFNIIVSCLIEAAEQAKKLILRRKFTRIEFKTCALTMFTFPKSISMIMDEMNIANSKQTISSWIKEMVRDGIIEKRGNLKSTVYVKVNMKYQK